MPTRQPPPDGERKADLKIHIKTRYQYWHERKLRNCLARFQNLNHQDVMLDTIADAKSKGFYFELDNGTANDAELIHKLREYYSG